MFYRKNIVDSPSFICGLTEPTTHYLFHCLRYTAQRQMYIPINLTTEILLVQSSVILLLPLFEDIFDLREYFKAWMDGLCQILSGCKLHSRTEDGMSSVILLLPLLIVINNSRSFPPSSWRYQRGNQNPYIEEEQTTQWPKEKEQKNKQRSTKHTHKTKDRVTPTSLTGVNLSAPEGHTSLWNYIVYVLLPDVSQSLVLLDL
jgi:hypothetical protein